VLIESDRRDELANCAVKRTFTRVLWIAHSPNRMHPTQLARAQTRRVRMRHRISYIQERNP
jgi:hypothetical protein